RPGRRIRPSAQRDARVCFGLRATALLSPVERDGKANHGASCANTSSERTDRQRAVAPAKLLATRERVAVRVAATLPVSASRNSEWRPVRDWLLRTRWNDPVSPGASFGNATGAGVSGR